MIKRQTSIAVLHKFTEVPGRTGTEVSSLDKGGVELKIWFGVPRPTHRTIQRILITCIVRSYLFIPFHLALRQREQKVLRILELESTCQVRTKVLIITIPD